MGARGSRNDLPWCRDLIGARWEIYGLTHGDQVAVGVSHDEVVVAPGMPRERVGDRVAGVDASTVQLLDTHDVHVAAGVLVGDGRIVDPYQTETATVG